MINHTPGPWEIEYDDLTKEWIVLWEVGSADVGGANAADNASLIAAAPDMFEELQYRYEQNRCGCGHPVCKFCEDDRQTLEVLRKAKGDAG